MIVADHLIPLIDCIERQFTKGSVAESLIFCKGEDQLEKIPFGSIVIVFAGHSSSCDFAVSILQHFGEMFPSWDRIKIYVLGSLITSGNSSYNCSSFSEVIGKVLECGLFPIIISSEPNPYAQTLCEIEKRNSSSLRVGFVTPSLSRRLPNGNSNIVGIVQDFNITKEDCISIIANQSYFTEPELEEGLKSTYFQEARLGLIRDKMHLSEPLIRDSKLLIVDTNAIRHSDFTSSTSPNPNGLYSEEICQLMRYAGYSDNLKSVFISGLQGSKIEEIKADSMLIAHMLWHTFEGISLRKKELPGLTNFASKEFFLELGEQEPYTLNFLQSQKTGRWWLYVPVSNSTGRWIACDAEDYERAKHHELPYRWISLYNLIG